MVRVEVMKSASKFEVLGVTLLFGVRGRGKNK